MGLQLFTKHALLLRLLWMYPPRRLYVAYTVFWALGGLLAMQIRFIGGNHLTSHELLSFNMVWLGLQVGTAGGGVFCVVCRHRYCIGTHTLMHFTRAILSLLARVELQVHRGLFLSAPWH